MSPAASPAHRRVFLCHAPEDAATARTLREELERIGLTVWDRARQIAPGDNEQKKIEQAIDASSHFLVVLSPASLRSKQVERETRRALRLKKQREKSAETTRLVVVPLFRPGVDPDLLPSWAPRGIRGIAFSDEVGALDAVIAELRVALGLELAEHDSAAPAVADRPQARLVLELSDPTMVGKEEQRHAAARARLRYFAPGRWEPADSVPHHFEAPLATVNAAEIAWYLERYPQWPSKELRRRAEEVEQALPVWGHKLYEALLPQEAQDVFRKWLDVSGEVERVFTVRVEPEVSPQAGEEQRELASEAASALLALPWELLHDGKDYLFQGLRAVRVRRQLPQREAMDSLPGELPVRVLVVSPRPEEEGVGYIDHRVSARPLLEAFEKLGGLAEVTLLPHPTFPALKAELKAAAERGQPYHVVHFDGHGVYDRRVGLGALCFEHPEDQHKDEDRRKEIIHADDLATVLRQYRVSLVFLEACQSAQADRDPTASVAGALLQRGVASVVAMSHTVLVETARRFVQAFYEALVQGRTVGAAMLAGREALYDDPNRGRAFIGKLELRDWFVPVLYQEETDPRLFPQRPSNREQEAHETREAGRSGGLPEPPKHTFVGRSRELLGVERRLTRTKYAVLLGEGGEGKTTLAVEAARWMVRTGRFQRAAFASLENLPDAHAVLVKLAEQLAPGFAGSDDEAWLQALERELKLAPTLLVIDNVESVLPPPPGSAVADLHNPELVEALLGYCQRLSKAGKTHLLFTSREALPTPFDGHTVRLGRLRRPEAIELVSRVLEREGDYTGEAGETEKDVADLVDTAQCHARALVLLAGEVKRQGLRQATLDLQAIMQDLEARHPGDRERSLLASVRLSLNRLPQEVREKIRPLGVFPGGGSLAAIAMVLGLDTEKDEEDLLAEQLVAVGLAELLEPRFLRFDPGLAQALLLELDMDHRGLMIDVWGRVMMREATAVRQLHFKQPQFAAAYTLRALSGWLIALERLASSASPEEMIPAASDVEELARILGRRQSGERAGQVRATAEKRLGAWGPSAFRAMVGTIQQLQQTGRTTEAAQAAAALLQRSEAAGEQAYRGAEYDLALAYYLLGDTTERTWNTERALVLLREAERRFGLLATTHSAEAARMAYVSRARQGDCLWRLGRLDAAVEIYERSAEEALAEKDQRQAAAVRFQIGTVRLLQRRFLEALDAYVVAREMFEQLGEPQSIALAWHQIGMTLAANNKVEEAEQAFLQALRLKTQLGDTHGEAVTLNELGLLYSKMNRLEERIEFTTRAARVFSSLGDSASEGRAWNNAAEPLIQLKRYVEARQALEAAIRCKAQLGHAVEPWTTFDILHDLERLEGNAAAAMVARQNAIASYLSYRRDGGEPHNLTGRLCQETDQLISQGTQAQAMAELERLLTNRNLPNWGKLLVPKLLQILDGSRDFALAEDPALHYTDAAELKLLLERLAAEGL